VVLAGYGMAGFQADAPSTQLVGKCGLNKDDVLDKQGEFEKSSELDKSSSLGVGVF